MEHEAQEVQNRAFFFESGWIRIRLDGRTVPTLWIDEYAQIFVEPGGPSLDEG